MPKYYCDYCDTYLTHDSPSVRKTHCTGRKHRDNVKFYYQKWMEEQAQHLIDATTAAFKAGKIAQNPFAAPPPKLGVNIPPPNQLGPPRPGMMPPVILLFLIWFSLGRFWLVRLFFLSILGDDDAAGHDGNATTNNGSSNGPNDGTTTNANETDGAADKAVTDNDFVYTTFVNLQLQIE